MRILTRPGIHPSRQLIPEDDDHPSVLRHLHPLWRPADLVERIHPRPLEYTPWRPSPDGLEPGTPMFDLYTDGSARTTAGYGWALFDAHSQTVDEGSGSLGAKATSYDGEVAAIRHNE